jgi:hypothetical protein
VIADRVAIYVKYSTNRLSPWSFNFSLAHQQELQALTTSVEAAFVALVCGRDGIACLSSEELGRVLDGDHRDMEWVKASRRPREKYSITGSDDRRGFKVADNEFAAKIFAVLAKATA